MSDLISRKAAIDAICKACSMGGDYHECEGYTETSTWCDYLVALRALPTAEPERCEDCGNFNKTMLLIPQPERKKGEWTTEEVAEMLARVFGDECACNFNGFDEWLPSACKYADTECPTPKEKHGCWIQFLMQGGVEMRGGENES